MTTRKTMELVLSLQQLAHRGADTSAEFGSSNSNTCSSASTGGCQIGVDEDKDVAF
jgi:hypothetical protein